MMPLATYLPDFTDVLGRYVIGGFAFLRSPVSSMHKMYALPESACFSKFNRLSHLLDAPRGVGHKVVEHLGITLPRALAMAGRVLRLVSESMPRSLLSAFTASRTITRSLGRLTDFAS